MSCTNRVNLLFTSPMIPTLLKFSMSLMNDDRICDNIFNVFVVNTTMIDRDACELAVVECNAEEEDEWYIKHALYF